MALPSNVYYNPNKLDSYNAMYNFVIGQRGDGKSFALKKKCIKAYLKNGEQFVYLRRHKGELREINSFFGDVSIKFPGVEFRVNGHVFETRVADKWRTMGVARVLSSSQQSKSGVFNEVTKVVFDEFIKEKGLTQYLPNEDVMFDNFYNTLDRFNDRVRAYFLGNAVELSNPHLLRYELDTSKEFQTFADGFVCVNIVDSTDYLREVEKSRFAKFIRATSPDYANYAMDNAFADGGDYMIAEKPSHMNVRGFIRLRGVKLSLWSSPNMAEWYVSDRQPNADLITWVRKIEDVREDTVLLPWNSKLASHWRTCYNHGRIAFSSKHVRNCFLDIFKRW
jgi:encapsidation protein